MSNILPGQDLDLSFLHEIADGSNEFIIESIEMFLQHTPEILQEITGAIKEKNLPTIASAAHKLKSNLGFFGMPISQEIIQEVELMAKGGAPDYNVLTSKFDEAKGIISANLISLTNIKTDLEVGG